MALDVAAFTLALRGWMDRDFVDYVQLVDEADGAARWAAAVDDLIGGGLKIVPPTTTAAIAKGVIHTSLLGMSAPGAGPVVLDLAFAAYAAALVPGMLPAFVGVPPPLPLSPLLIPKAALALVPPGIPGEIQIGIMAALIAGWFLTGSSTPSGGGPPTPWS